MGMLWYIALAVLFLAVVIIAVPGDEAKPQAPPDPRGVMLHLDGK